MTTPKGATAPYLQVVADIRKKIESGQLRPGDRIPSQRTIATDYQVAPMTASKAIRTLCDGGWATSVPSLGVFVSEAPPASEAASVEELRDEVRELRDLVTGLTARVDRIANQANES
ncbi:GntR family transcriptional regulator [Nocardia sp. alder85J]|uniref:GntR family transcriptional regulator n=1 Tax=Nocardia sp. alder85J TaxID=2862949 RepID=UPI001CD44F72|nr:winged helix-turn-helix domain-containing protein [Nocardia sp. alder85J]MCX4097300.1 winged helix-turn-helix domain-containing protein [Nocardia sp. alder85J]